MTLRRFGIWPRSLFGRLLAIATVAITAALLFAAVSIGHVLERFVMRGLDQQLDAQVLVLARAVRPDGTVAPGTTIDLGGFGDHAGRAEERVERRTPDHGRGEGLGWGWRIDGGTTHLTGGDAPPPNTSLPSAEIPDDGPRPGESHDRAGRALHTRTLTIPTTTGPVTISASGPRRIVEAPLREAMIPLLASLGLLGAGLAIATLVQLRVGLRPLRQLQGALADVRSGTRNHVPTDLPEELRPLAVELNALIDENAQGLAHARQHVANLAHGLKTPLAALSLRLAETGADDDLRDMVGQIDRRVRHHLGRARATAPGGTGRMRTMLVPAVDDLLGVLHRIHADRSIVATVDIPATLAVAVDPQDLDEMIGNLLDNGWRHAAHRLSITGHAEGQQAVVAITDDGPGIGEAAIADALLPGRRLDERGDGHGFGLSITRELAELNGGSLDLGRAPDTETGTGGLVATLRLPMRA